MSNDFYLPSRKGAGGGGGVSTLWKEWMDPTSRKIVLLRCGLRRGRGGIGRSKFRHGIGGELPFLSCRVLQTTDVAKLSKNSAPQLKKGNLKLAVGSNILSLHLLINEDFFNCNFLPFFPCESNSVKYHVSF